MTDQSGLLVYEPASGEDSEVRNSAHIVSSSQLLVLVGVDLQNNGAASHLGRCSCNLWGGRVTGATPFGPEINEYRHL